MRMPRPLSGLLVLLAAGLLAWWLLAPGTPSAPPALELEGDAPAASPDVPPPARAAEGPVALAPDEQPDRAPPHRRAGSPAAIRGLVVDEDGRGLAGATVAVHRVDPASLRGAPYPDDPALARTTSERDGAFVLADVPSGRWLRLVGSHPGHATVGRLLPAAGAVVTLVLPPAGGLHLTVVDTDDRPVPDAAVHAANGPTRTLATTDAAGQVRFDALPPGPVRVQLVSSTHGNATAGPWLVRAGETLERLVLVARGLHLGGTVVDAATDAPVADAWVRVARPGTAAGTTTDARGRFGPVPAGGLGERVLVAVEAEGYAPTLQPLVLRGSEDVDTLVRLTAAAPWQGRVVDAAGRPVAGAEVRYTADGIAAPRRDTGTTSDAEGRFTLPPPPPPAPGRRVVLTASAGGALGALALRPGQPAPPDLELVLDAGARVQGRVLAADGTPLAGVTVHLATAWSDVERTFQPDEATSRLHAFNAVGNLGLAASTGADGTWRLAGVPTGPYDVVVTHDGAEHRRDAVLVVASPSTDAGVLRLDGATIAGEVLDARGTGLGGVPVSARQAGGEGRVAGRTDARGGFELRGLAPGTWIVVAGPVPGRPRLQTPVDLTPEGVFDLRLQLEDPAEVDLRVTGPDGAPYAGLLTVAFGETGSGRAATRRHPLRVASGRATIPDAPVGLWTVEAFAPDGLRGQAPEVDVAVGRRTAVVLALARGARLTGTVRTADGAPVAGAALDLQQPATGARLAGSADARGRYAFEGLAPGDWTLQVHGRGGAPQRETVVLAAGEDRTLDPTLPEGGTLVVRVEDARGRPVPQALLQFRGPEGLVRTTTVPRTDADGRHVQPDLPAGTVVVRARAPDGSQAMRAAELGAGRRLEVVLVLTPPR